MNVYIVNAETGEYQDRQTWNVCVYTTKEQADDHARLANEYITKAQEMDYEARGEYADNNPYDPQCWVDSATGTHYSVQEILLVRHVDEYADLAGTY